MDNQSTDQSTEVPLLIFREDGNNIVDFTMSKIRSHVPVIDNKDGSWFFVLLHNIFPSSFLLFPLLFLFFFAFSLFHDN